MDYLPGGLPSLAHPLIGNAVLGSRNSKSSICRPPFSEIDPSWDGFTLTYLRWIGIKDTNYDPHWQFGLFLRHELSHNRLSFTPFSIVRWHRMHLFNKLIYKTFKNGKKRRQRIPVPLRSAQTRNVLEKEWGRIVNWHERAELVEELYAVRSSLLETSAVMKINSDELELLLRGYKRAYGKYIQGFREAYEAFDFIAGEIGEDAAEGMIYCALETFHPTETLLILLSLLGGLDLDLDLYSSTNEFQFQFRLSRKEVRKLASLSTEEAINTFGELIVEIDTEDALGIRALLDIIIKHNGYSGKSNKIVGHEVIDFLRNPSPPAGMFLLSSYREVIDGIFDMSPFVLTDRSKPRGGKRSTEQIIEDYYGNFFVLLEAIRQQLTQGNGLVCPFWFERRGCCSPQYKALLENVWSSTKPDSSCELWQRMGCLCQK